MIRGEKRETQIAEAYRRGYAGEPSEDSVGETGLRLGAELLAEHERAGSEPVG